MFLFRNGKHFKQLDKLLKDEGLEVVKVFSPIGSAPITIPMKLSVLLREQVKEKGFWKKISSLNVQICAGKFPEIVGIHFSYSSKEFKLSILTNADEAFKSFLTLPVLEFDGPKVSVYYRLRELEDFEFLTAKVDSFAQLDL